jgi:hypothetical protein
MPVLIKRYKFNYMVQSKYSFPNVSINTSVPGPAPNETGQRRRIGVAGVFDRGPEFQLINSREEFAYLYGENNAPGSVFVRQAMLQGADQFAISRVMPSLRPSKGSISLANGTNPFSPANVAIQGNRTIGLKFSVSYLSSVVTAFGQYNRSSVTTSKDSDITLPLFNGAGTFNFQVIEEVAPSNIQPSNDINLELKDLTLEDNLLDSETFGSNQVIQTDPFYSEVFTGDAGLTNNLDLKRLTLAVTSAPIDIARLKTHAKPGLILKSGAASFPSGGLIIASYAFQLSGGQWGVLLNGTAEVSGPIIATVHPTNPSTNYFVVSYSYTSPTFSQLPNYVYGSRSYSFGTDNNLRNINALGFLVIDTNNLTSKNLEVIGRYGLNGNPEDNILIYFETGIKLNFTSLTAQNTLELLAGNRFSLSAFKSTVTIGEIDPEQPNSTKAFKPGTPAVDILNELKDSLSKDSVGSVLLEEISVNNLQLPYTLDFSTNFRGAEANRVKYKLERVVSGGEPLDLIFGANGLASKYNREFNMSGGQSTMSAARRVLYDINGNPLVLIEAISPGVEGNRIRISVNSNRPGQFQLTVDDEEGSKFNIPIRSETFLLSNYTVDPQTGLYPETIDSNIIRAYFLPTVRNRAVTLPARLFDLTPQRIAPISQFVIDVNDALSPSHTGTNFLRDLYLEQGTTPISYNALNPQPQDYVDAIERLEAVDCVSISAPSVAVSDSRYDAVISSLVLQAQNSTTLNGIRTAIIAAPKGLSASRAISISAPFNSNRVVIVSGWSSLVGTAGLGFNNASPEGLYAGILANLPPHISPAAAERGTAINGVFSVDTNTNPTVLDALTRANIEVLFFDAGLGIFKFLNGLNTDRSSTMKIVSVSRMNDKIIEDLNNNLSWVKSRPNDRSLQRNTRDAVDAYFRTLLREQQIFSFSPTICDSSNNSPEDRARRRLNITISYTPVYPADFINVSLIQSINDQLSFTTS